MIPSRAIASNTIPAYCCTEAAVSNSPSRSVVPIMPLHASAPDFASKSRVSETVRVLGSSDLIEREWNYS